MFSDWALDGGGNGDPFPVQHFDISVPLKLLQGLDGKRIAHGIGHGHARVFMESIGNKAVIRSRRLPL